MALIPNTNVNLATNVRDVLNNSGGNVTNELITFFKPQANLNKWSKHKPVKYHTLFTISDDEYDRLYDDKLYWWKAYDGLCGFTKDSIEFSSLDALVNAYMNNAVYVYELPTGGSLWPYRLGDFRNYYTDAESPIYSFEITAGQMIYDAGHTYHDFEILENSDIDERYNLTLSDISPDGDSITLDEWFYGIIISDGSSHFTKKSSTTIGSNTGHSTIITLTLQEMMDRSMGAIGDYTAYPFITNGTGKRFIACDVSPIQFSVIRDPAEERVGWMESEPHYYVQTGGKKSFYATLAWHEAYDYEGAFDFSAYSVSADGTIDEIAVVNDVTPQKDGQSATSDSVYYMEIGNSVEVSGSSATSDDETFYLKVSYASSTGKTISKTIECKGQTVDPENA